ncbi:endosialidase [Eubacterium sp. MSJ-33]|uniref:endosialidase n=1 Tax=Eubacterium sp. MSJ-33 TaxID=2841528 RepID=UPI001C79202C|nr:endosialidase [Eubacterium sp. MSJ-33]QWT54104.1 endosialidase [Eubacterium sp. MSJ-33]
MAVIDELIREEETGALSFGNFALATKTKKDGFQYQGDSYKIKTFREITKLERNGMFVYESVPGTVVHDFRATDKAVNFVVEGEEDSQITLELEAEKEYKIHIDKVYVGKMKTNLGGKLNLSVELEPSKMVDILVEKI